jgi:hypothetical protein
MTDAIVQRFTSGVHSNSTLARTFGDVGEVQDQMDLIKPRGE